MVRKNIPVNVIGKDLSTVGGRLSAERQRVRLTVADFALQCGVTKQTQIKYEANANFPDTRYLEAAITRGVDVMYVLTGLRSIEAMSDEHQNLVEAYEAAPIELRKAAFAVLISPYRRDLDLARCQAGYFQYQILGESDVRYEGRSGKQATPQSSSEEFDASLKKAQDSSEEQ